MTSGEWPSWVYTHQYKHKAFVLFLKDTHHHITHEFGVDHAANLGHKRELSLKRTLFPDGTNLGVFPLKILLVTGTASHSRLRNSRVDTGSLFHGNPRDPGLFLKPDPRTWCRPEHTSEGGGAGLMMTWFHGSDTEFNDGRVSLSKNRSLYRLSHLEFKFSSSIGL